MADLIFRKAAIEYLMTNMGWHDEDGYAVDDADEKRGIITDLVNGIPAVDAAPVVHGRWTTKRTWKHDGEWYCSVCDYEPIVFMESNYCPNCGARMDGDTE